jgi:hypothetical protein
LLKYSGFNVTDIDDVLAQRNVVSQLMFLQLLKTFILN